jgi:hypothetical protein
VGRGVQQAPRVEQGVDAMIDVKTTFEKHDDEYLQFDKVESPRHPRADVCAFLMLHDLAPRDPFKGKTKVRDMVSCAEHDEIWLDTDIDVLAQNATEADIVTLARCGVRYDASVDRLAMYV